MPAKFISAAATLRSFPPANRDLAMVLENLALFPHMSTRKI